MWIEIDSENSLNHQIVTRYRNPFELKVKIFSYLFSWISLTLTWRVTVSKQKTFLVFWRYSVWLNILSFYSRKGLLYHRKLQYFLGLLYWDRKSRGEVFSVFIRNRDNSGEEERETIRAPYLRGEAKRSKERPYSVSWEETGTGFETRRNSKPGRGAGRGGNFKPQTLYDKKNYTLKWII